MDPLIHTIKFDNPCQGQANGFAGYYFTQMVSMVLASHCTLGNPDDYPRDFGNQLMSNDEFDFIIIGGGSAGSVIASRLSEIPTWKILLIEAGENPTFESDVPSFSLSLPGSELDWSFKLDPNGHSCLGMENETCTISQGRVLGGTSTINGMHYFRGNEKDYDEWESLGNKGWAFDSVLGYFKKSEKLEDDFRLVNDANVTELFGKSKKLHKTDEWKLHLSSKIAGEKYHSKNGVMGVNHFAYDVSLARLKRRLCEAAEELDVPHVTDINRKRQIGCVEAMAVLHEASRGNAAKNFLLGAKNRENIYVVKNATVEKLIVEDNSVRGVKLLLKEREMSVFAKKEVILSAGAINSPRLLLLSGIGPKKDLQAVGVDVVHDLPGVGQNLQMHVTFFGFPVLMNRNKPTASMQLEKFDAMYHFVTKGAGMFGNVGLNDIVTFASTMNESVPDVQFFHHFNRFRDHYTFNELLVSLGVNDKIRNELSKAYSKSDILLICPTLLRPTNRGRVKIVSPRFNVPPKILSESMLSEDDIRTLIRSIKLAVLITETEALKEFDPQILRLNIEECRSFEFKSDEYWTCLIGYLTTPTNEVGGTCKMGPEHDPWAVVDDELKVRGIKGLRVSDSSVMPKIIRGSTSVASVMIGEKVSDLIKNVWKEAIQVNDEL